MSIPTIDLTDLGAAEPAAVERVAAAIAEIFSSVGFAYLSGHGVPDAVIEDAFDASRAFHALPTSAKMAIEINEQHRGYIPINTSTVVTSTVDVVTRPNQSASLMIMHEPEGGPDGVLDGPNQWPQGLPNFRRVIEEYSSAMERVARSLIGPIEVALGASPNELAQHFDYPTTFLRLLHYPADPARGDSDFGSAPHSDYGFITLLAQDSVGGLQVRSPSGAWLDVEPRTGTLVMNTADILRRWSNGRLISTPHRVQAATVTSRYSLPFFFDPHATTVVRPLASCIAEGAEPGYEPVVFGDYLMHRLRRNHKQHRVSDA